MHDSAWTGEYYLLDQPVHALDKKKRAELQKKTIGFVFQSYHLLDDLTVYENLEIPLSYRDVKKSERQSIVADTLDRFQIVGKKDLYPTQLSGGQQQLVAVARAVVANPKVILADEPTGNLHSSQAQEIMELFKKLNARGHHDRPGHPLGDERGLRRPDHQDGGRLGRQELTWGPGDSGRCSCWKERGDGGPGTYAARPAGRVRAWPDPVRPAEDRGQPASGRRRAGRSAHDAAREAEEAGPASAPEPRLLEPQRGAA